MWNYRQAYDIYYFCIKPFYRLLYIYGGDKMDKVLMSTGKDDWGTPQALYDILNEEFGFTLDVCASAYNYKCSKYYTIEDDGLSKSWAGETVFCNPPYSKKGKQAKWVEKCYKEAKENNITVVMLLPARTDTKVFHDYLIGKAEIRFIKGRLKFEDEYRSAKEPAPFPSMVAIYHGDKMCDKVISVSY